MQVGQETCKWIDMAPETNALEAQAKPEATWVDVISGSEVHRERAPTRLLRVRG